VPVGVAKSLKWPVVASRRPRLKLPDLDQYRIVTDAVMGGESAAKLNFSSGVLTFEGVVSLKNNGGFASFVGPIALPREAHTLALTVSGDGKRYKVTLKRKATAAICQYQACFSAPSDWITLRFSSRDFVPSFRGRAIDQPPIHIADAQLFGLLISEAQAGSFRVALGGVSGEP
jgi:NADH dehydrogenase [ubiquinone] 1 alpha subcomplex assembly factor 1